MKTLLLVTLLFCAACGIDKTKGSNKNVSLEPFNYDCTHDEGLSEEGFEIFYCTERTTQKVCEVVLGPNEYFSGSDCEELNMTAFEQYLKEGGLQ